MDGNGWLELISFVLTDWLMPVTEAAYYALLLAAIVLVVNVLFRRWISAGQMALLWGLVLLRLVVPVAPSSPLSLESLLQPAEQAAETRNAIPATSGTPRTAANSVSDSAKVLSETSAAKAQQESNREQAIYDGVPVLWGLVGVGGLGYTVAGYVWFRRRVARAASCADERILRLWTECCQRASVKRTGRIVQFDGVEQPAIMGVFRPTLLLPTSGMKLRDEQLRMVMLHELAHVRRWDVAGNWALVLVRAIHWWNPVYWLAAAQFRSLREQACDAFVVRTLGNSSTQSYGELLLSLAQKRPNGAAWRVTLPASMLSFFPSLFRRRAVRVRLSALRRASVRHGRWQTTIGVLLCLLLVVCGFTVAREEAEKPVDLATWMASHPDAVLTPKRSFLVEETYEGPRETRRYDVAKVIDQLVEEAGSKDRAGWLLEVTLKQFFFHHRIGNDGTVQAPSVSSDLAKFGDAARTSVDRSLLICKVEGTTLIATAPAALHERLAGAIDAWGENGLAQITIETRFLNANRELVSELGVSWEFLEAFSPERETSFPSAKSGDGPVVRAESRVDEYLPLVVATLNAEQTTRLIDRAQGDRRANVLNAPKVTIFNGMEAIIADCAQRPFVVGVFQRTAGATEPKVVVLEEGTKIKVRAVVGREKVRLQASVEMKVLGDVATATTLYRGSQVSIQVPSVNRRSIDVDAELDDGQTLLVGSIPLNEQQKYSYYLVSAKKLDIE